MAARTVTGELKSHAVLLGGTLGIFWAVFALNLLLGGALFAYGIVPRTTTGLRGIVFSPFLHVSTNHLAANSVPFVILGWLILLRDARHFIPVTLFAMLGAGLTAWLLGSSNSVHIGASGVIFGYLGFLMLSGWYARSIGSVILSLLVTATWGGLVWGVLPGQAGISWQAHLGGFVGGVAAARAFRRG